MRQIVKRVNVSTLRDDLALALRKVEYGGLCYVVSRYDRPVAALVSMETLRQFWDWQLDGEHEDTEKPEGEPEAQVQGYLGRLWSRRKRREVGRAALGESESKSDRWRSRNFRGMDDEV